jgi:hypothetical protein
VTGRWQAKVKLEARWHWLGLHDTAAEAARAAAAFRAQHMPFSSDAQFVETRTTKEVVPA